MPERCLGVVWVTVDTVGRGGGWTGHGSGGVQVINKNPIGLIFISWFLFSQLPRISSNVPYFGVSGKCLGGVWGLSE